MASPIALYTTIYPDAKRFVRAWHSSVRAQSDDQFELCIGLDGVTPDEANEAAGQDLNATWFTAENGEKPMELRLRAVKAMARNYDSMIFVDCDDLLLPDRVASARYWLSVYDVIGCALNIIDESGEPLGSTFRPSRNISSFGEFLVRYNIFGLSNTAYRSHVFTDCPPLPADCVLLDWLLATRAAAGGAKMFFDAEPHMNYRQYSANVARVLLPFTGTQVLQATERVLSHYQCVVGMETFPDWSQRVRLLARQEEVKSFDRRVRQDSHALDAYVQALNHLPVDNVWWWCVANPGLKQLWNN